MLVACRELKLGEEMEQLETLYSRGGTGCMAFVLCNGMVLVLQHDQRAWCLSPYRTLLWKVSLLLLLPLSLPHLSSHFSSSRLYSSPRWSMPSAPRFPPRSSHRKREDASTSPVIPIVPVQVTATVSHILVGKWPLYFSVCPHLLISLLRGVERWTKCPPAPRNLLFWREKSPQAVPEIESKHGEVLSRVKSTLVSMSLDLITCLIRNYWAVMVWSSTARVWILVLVLISLWFWVSHSKSLCLTFPFALWE